jgi:nicotinic acid phosphoribosyltransferase
VPGGLLTDLYELNMAASYLRRSMTGQATFSLFIRTLPPGRGFLVAAGLADCLRFLEDFSFTADDLSYLRQARGHPETTLREFAGLRFTGDVRAIPEGRVVFAGEPLLEVTAPIAEAQLAETVLLNHVTFQTAVAAKAARCVLLDSGDLAALARMARAMLDEAGLADARIFASGSLDEYAIAALVAAGAPIDAYGVGTLREEPPPPGCQPLLVPVMRRGRPVSNPEPLAAAQQRCRADLADLPPAARALRDPVPVPVQISDQLKILQDQVTRDLRRRAGIQHGPEGR